jgi:inorganic triphosphatase YgiF
MPQEVELKLALDPRDVPALRESWILRELGVKHTGRRRLLSIYYDTPFFSLAQRGITLRVRTIGRERVQCVKMKGAEGGSLHQRMELGSSIRGDRPDLTQIPDPDLRRLILECSADNELVPVFSTNVMRETWLQRLGRSQIECAIDRGVIAANGTRAPVCEVELELKSGQAARLFQLAHRLNAVVPLRIETTSKAARGYDLAAHAKLPAPMAAPINIHPDMTVRECFAAIARPSLAHVLASANFAYTTDDPEGIHQLRVAIRRMRAAFSVFRSAMLENHRLRLGDELRTLQQKLGAAREWDVLVEETIASMPRKLREQRSTEHLVRIAHSKRAEGDKSAHAALRNPQYTDILLRLASWVDGQFGSEAPPIPVGKWKPDVLADPARGFATEMMRVYHDKLKKLGKKIRKLDAAELHRLRIRVKKLRYATEFFSSIWPNQRTKRYLSALKGLQQVLGELHDATVAEGLVARLSLDKGSDGKLASEPVNRWLIRHQRRGRNEVIELWSKFAKQKLFWERT